MTLSMIVSCLLSCRRGNKHQLIPSLAAQTLTWLCQVAVAGVNFVFGFLLVVGSYVMVRSNCMHKGTASDLLKRML
jgi:nucleoside permease NupC